MTQTYALISGGGTGGHVFPALALAEELVARNKKIGWRHLALDPAWTFFRTLILQRGFLDGTEGLAIAWMGALYQFLKFAKAKNMLPGRET